MIQFKDMLDAGLYKSAFVYNPQNHMSDLDNHIPNSNASEQIIDKPEAKSQSKA